MWALLGRLPSHRTRFAPPTHRRRKALRRRDRGVLHAGGLEQLNRLLERSPSKVVGSRRLRWGTRAGAAPAGRLAVYRSPLRWGALGAIAAACLSRCGRAARLGLAPRHWAEPQRVRAPVETAPSVAPRPYSYRRDERDRVHGRSTGEAMRTEVCGCRCRRWRGHATSASAWPTAQPR